MAQQMGSHLDCQLEYNSERLKETQRAETTDSRTAGLTVESKVVTSELRWEQHSVDCWAQQRVHWWGHQMENCWEWLTVVR